METEKKVPASVGATAIAGRNQESPNEGGQAGGAAAAEAGAAAGQEGGAAAASGADDTDEQLAKLLESKGITGVKSFDELAQRLSSGAGQGGSSQQEPELTPEQKLEIERAEEKKMLDVYLASGGTVEQFAAIKQVSAMDVVELSKNDAIKELLDAGFSKDEAESIVAERYYQINLDEIEQDDDETDEEFEKRKEKLKKKNEYGLNKFTSRGKRTQENAKAALETLRASIKESESQKREAEELEKKISSKTDGYLATAPKKITVELGKGVDESDLPPVQYTVDDSDMEEVRSLLKSTEQRNNLLFTQDGEINVESIAGILLENRNLKKAAKVAYLQGGSDQIAKFRTVFPHASAHELGINSGSHSGGGSSSKKPVAIGKTTRAN